MHLPLCTGHIPRLFQLNHRGAKCGLRFSKSLQSVAENMEQWLEVK